MAFLARSMLRIISVSLICGFVTSLTGKSRTAGEIRLLCGCVLLITLLSDLKPLLRIPAGDMIERSILEAKQQSLYGEQQARENMEAIIKDSCEAYILDKAEELAAPVTVQVELSDEDIPVPCGAVITGHISGEAKAELSRILAEDLGISKEAQLWIG